MLWNKQELVGMNRKRLELESVETTITSIEANLHLNCRFCCIKKNIIIIIPVNSCPSLLNSILGTKSWNGITLLERDISGSHW